MACIGSQAKSRKHSIHECLSYQNAQDYVFFFVIKISLCSNVLIIAVCYSDFESSD